MKRTLLIALPVSIIFAACNSDTKTAKEDTTKTQVKGVTTPPDPVSQKIDELKGMSTIGLNQLSAWLPDQLNGIKRSNLSMNSDMGYEVAHADYEKNSKTDMRVTVYDCAGQAGADLYKTNYVDRLKVPEENE